MKRIKIADCELPPNPREFAAALLGSAASILRGNPGGERDDSAVWRVADAGLVLRGLIEESGAIGVAGVDEPTGMGARLPVLQ